MSTEAAPLQLNGRYILQEQIGSGGMGVVYRALDRLTKNRVALKRVTATVDRLRFAGMRRQNTPTLRPDDETQVIEPPSISEIAAASALPEIVHSGGSRAHSRKTASTLGLLLLAKEYQLLSSLRHPNIISVLDYGFDASRQPFYTMELLEGCPTLAEAAAQADLRRKVELLVEILRALMYLHRRGIVHRDLKPTNVMVAGHAKLLDFGVAIHTTDYEGVFAGTISHMAPELLRHEAPSEASDLYAVGVMAYEMFTGDHPFPARTRSDMILGHLKTEPDLTRLPLEVPLQGVLAKLLCKNPKDRYSDAATVIADLGRAIGEDIAIETQATRTSFLERAAFVGRDAERTRLLQAIDKAFQREGELVLLEGESGIGKSRLLDELRNVALSRGVAVVTAQASGYRAAYNVWREILRNLVLTTPLTQPEASILKLLLPDLDELIDREVPSATPDSRTAQADLMAAIRSIFERQREPMLVVLEDVHREPECLTVLQELAKVIHSLPVVLVCSYRGEEAPWMIGALAGASRIQLDRLATTDVTQLARSILGTRGGAPNIVQFLEQHTEGNVFFIVETLRALAEQVGELGKIGETSLPSTILAESVESLLEHRISLAPAVYRSMLEYAALMGRQLDVKVLEELDGAQTVYDGLITCTQLSLLEVRSDTWRFAHDKLREALLRQIQPEKARSLHGRIAETIESIYPGSENHYAILAHHFGMAGNLQQEMKYSALAGRSAIRYGGYKDAIVLLERALQIQRELPAPDPSVTLELLLNVGSVQIVLSGWAAAEVRNTYDEAIELAKQTHRETAVAPALVGLSKSLFFNGKLRSGQSMARQCLELAEASGDIVMKQHGLLMTGEIGVWLGESSKDQTYASEIARLYHPSQAQQHLTIYGQSPRLSSLAAFTAGTWMRGFPDDAVALSKEAAAIAHSEKNAFSEAIAYQIGGWVHQLRGETAKARKQAALLSAVSSESGFISFRLLAQIFEGWVEARETGTIQGVERIQDAIKQWRELGATLALTYYMSILGDAALASGADEMGSAGVEQALSGAFGEERCYHPELYRLQAEFLARSGCFEKSREALDSALVIASEQQARSWELRILTTMLRILPPPMIPTQTREQLAALLQWFSTHGFTPDFAAAQNALRTERVF